MAEAFTVEEQQRVDLIRVGQWLQATLQPDKATREQAEQALKLSENEPGHIVRLFKLAVDSSLQVEPVLRHSAVVYLKNVVKQRWDPPEPPPHRKNEPRTEPINEADKAIVRENLVEALVIAESKVRAQLGLCLRHMAYADYPDKWPSLLGSIGAKLTSSEQPQMHAGLFALRVLAKIHEYRRERAAINQIVNDTFPILLQLLRSIVAAPPSVASAELALLATKVIWSCVQYSLPPQLLHEGACDHLFETLLALLAQPLPEGAPTDEEDASAWAPWKVKKRVAQTLQRMVSRHANIKKEDGGGEESSEGGGALARLGGGKSTQTEEEKAAEQQLKVFARLFQDRYSSQCLQGCLDLLARARAGGVLPGRVHTYCLNYIEEACKYKATYVYVLKPRLESLFNEVIYPPLCFSKADAELWEEDPNEFVRRSFDFVADFFSPRTAAQRLLATLAEKRAKDCLHGFVLACSAVLQRTQQATDEASLMQKDGALLAIGSLQKQLMKKEQYAGSIEPMLRLHVLPTLASPAGFLRQRACWVYSEFTPAVFNGKKKSHGSPAMEQITQVFPRLVELLRDGELPVRVQAALTIKELIEAKCLTDAVIAVLPQLLDCLFSLIREVGADEVVATLDTLIEHHGEQMAPYSLQVVTALVASFMRLVDEEDGDGKDDDGDGGDAVIAAMSVLQALTTMCEAVHNMGEPAGELFVQLQAPLLPLFKRCIQDADGEDYIEDMLEVLSYITYHAKAIPPPMWELVPMMHAAFHDWAREYLNQMMGPLDNLISRSPELFLTLENGRYVEMILSMCRLALIGEGSDEIEESDLHGAPQLLESILQNCHGRVDPILKDVLAITLMRLDKPEENVPLRVLLYNVLSSALYYNASATLQVLEHRQATQQALGAWFQHLTSCEKLRVRDCKLALLGTSALLALPSAHAPPMIASNRLMLMKLGATLLGKSELALQKRKEGEGDDDDDDDDDEDGDDDDPDLFGGELGDDDEGEDDSNSALARLLRSDKRFAGFSFGDDDDDDFEDEDDLSDDEDHESPIDQLDELVALTDAAQAACAEDPSLLARVGLNTQPDVAVELAAEDVARLRAALESGVAKKHAAAAGGGA